MSTLAEMLVGAAIDSTDPAKAPDVAGHFAQGYALAQKDKEIQMQRQHLEQQKKSVADAKEQHLYEAFVAGTKMDPKTQKMYFDTKGPFRQKRDALGLTNDFADDKLDWMTATPENLSKARGVIEARRQGQIDGPTMVATIFDAQKYPDLVPYHEDLNKEAQKASSEFLANQASIGKTQMTVSAENQRQKVGLDSTGQVELTKRVADEYTKWQAVGGSAGLDKTEAALKDAINKLKTGEVKTGGLVENLPYGGTTAVTARLNKPFKALQDAVLSTQNIKALSGDPNPTERQIQDINSRLLDPAASNDVNITKLRNELKRVQTERATKESQFISSGFMQAPTKAPARSKAPSQAPSAQAAPPEPTATLQNGVQAPISSLKAFVQAGSIDGSQDKRIN